MAVFIIAPETDLHANRIQWGLRESGVETIRWNGPSSSHSASICFNGNDSVFLDERSIKPQDTVWIRGLSAHAFTHQECDAFQRSLLMSIERSGAFCINKWSAARLIENQSFQLALARQCGLRVPATVMSTSPGFAHEFFAGGSAAIIQKTFSGVPPDPASALAPGIYQQRIDQRCDIRVVMLNRDFHSFKVAPPAAAKRLSRVDRVSLPAPIEAKLRRFAEHADLAFGCFKLLVDRAGEWWFLEVDHAGEFLWIDDAQPDHGLFQPMLDLLSSREGSPNLTFPSYRQCVSECGSNQQVTRTGTHSPRKTSSGL